MSAYLYAAPAGVPGAVTRPDESNVEPIMLVSVSGVYPTAFGVPLKYVAGGAQQFNGGAEVAADFAGILIREVPGISGSTAQGLTDAAPYPVEPQGMLVRGYGSVVCAAGTPVRGALAYIQIIANGGVAVGAFRASSDGSNSIQTTQVIWASDGKDADNNAEVRVAR